MRRSVGLGTSARAGFGVADILRERHGLMRDPIRSRDQRGGPETFQRRRASNGKSPVRWPSFHVICRAYAPWNCASVMRNGFGAPGRGHPSSPRSRSERHVAHGHPSRSSIRPIRATWPSANRIVTPSSRLTSRSTGSLLSPTAPGCLIPAQTTRREGLSTKLVRTRSGPPAALAARPRAARAPTDLSRTHPESSRAAARDAPIGSRVTRVAGATGGT